MDDVLKVVICICLVCLSAFLGCMAGYVCFLTFRMTGLPMDKKKAAEAMEEKERKEKAERARAKVGKII